MSDYKTYIIEDEDIIYIGVFCPQCGAKFNMMDYPPTFGHFNLNGRKMTLLFCGKCEIDRKATEKKILNNTLPLKECGTEPKGDQE